MEKEIYLKENEAKLLKQDFVYLEENKFCKMCKSELTEDHRNKHKEELKSKAIEIIKESNGIKAKVKSIQSEIDINHELIRSTNEEKTAHSLSINTHNQKINDLKNDIKNAELKAILAHNRDEEKEHAAMVLEWIRRQDPSFDKELKDYLFTDKPIAHD